MELPIALDVSLKALLSCHSVHSWKIATEGQNPTVILRLRPETQQSVCRESVDTAAFKRKPPCQILRDRRRADQYRKKRDYVENTNVPESKCDNQSQTTFENEMATENIDKNPSGNNNGKDDSVSQHTSQCSAIDTTDRAARGGDTRWETAETAARNDSRDHESQNEMETDTQSESDNESSESDTETKVTETESEQRITNIARHLIKRAKHLGIRPDILRQEDRNNIFNRIVLDRRCREAPSLVCISHDVIVTCYIETGETNFELRDPGDYCLGFWYFWPEIDRGGYHKENIDRTWIEMEKVWNRVRKMI